MPKKKDKNDFLHARVNSDDKCRWNMQAIREGKSLAGWVTEILNWAVKTKPSRIAKRAKR